MPDDLLQKLISVGGLTLVALVLLQGLMLFVSTARRHRAELQTRRLEMEILQSRVSAAHAKRLASQQAATSWNGWRKFKVEKKNPEGGDICSFYLVPHDKKPLPSFKPGQYLTFQLHIPGHDKPVIRCYSLSDAPNPNYYRVSIKRIPPPKDKPDAPPGLGSNFFHKHINEGDIIDVKAPGGHFWLDMEEDFPVVLIGGGVGITPVLSMINLITQRGQKRETWFFLGVRDRKEHVFKEHLEKLAAEHDNIKLMICYSQPGKDDVKGRDYQHAERVTVDLFKKVLPSNNYDYYMCGPGPMMESVVSGLEKWGVPEAKIHYEAFGPASVKKVAAAAPAAPAAAAAGAAGIQVTFGKSGKTCSWSAGSILELAEANGVKMDFGCRAGNCGTCVTAIKEGEVTYNTPPGSPPDAGSCLTCISSPKGKLVLDA